MRRCITSIVIALLVGGLAAMPVVAATGGSSPNGAVQRTSGVCRAIFMAPAAGRFVMATVQLRGAARIARYAVYLKVDASQGTRTDVTTDTWGAVSVHLTRPVSAGTHAVSVLVDPTTGTRLCTLNRAP